MISEVKLKNYLLSVQHKTEKFVEDHDELKEVKLLNAGMMDLIDDLFDEIESGRLSE